jgi:hypothetical protein
MNIPDGDKPWRDHLMGPEGCVKNPRRIQALKKSKKQSIEKFSIEFICLFFLDKYSNQQKSVVVPTSQVNVMKKSTTGGQKKVPTTVK